MDKKLIKSALDEAKKNSPKRNFVQSFDLIVTLQDLNLKNPEEQVEFFATLTHSPGKKFKICAITGPELSEQGKSVCDFTIDSQDFAKYADKKLLKQVARTYDYFIAQANIMPKVAGTFGRALGPRGKMPNPKAGCVVPGNAALRPIYDRLQNTVKVSARKVPVIQLIVGKESQPEDEVIDNINTVYEQLIHHLPKEKNNIRNVYVKLTMGKPYKMM